MGGIGDVTGDPVGPDDVCRLSTGLGHQARDEDDPLRVDDIGREQGGDQLVAQRMPPYLLLEPLRDRPWEVVERIGEQVRVLDHH